MLSKYEQTLLQAWEEVYKRGQLTLWILLGIKDGPKYMSQIKEFISHQTNDVLQADDKSMYRALRRFDEAQMISYVTKPSDNGPDHKVYSLTPTGKQILDEFIKRTFIDVFYKPSVKQLVLGK